MPIVVEYLVVLPQADTFCDSIAGFNRLLEADSTISLGKKTDINYKMSANCTFTCQHRIRVGNVAGKEGQRYFHLSFTYDGDPESPVEDVEKFTALLRTVRKVVATLRGQVETLRDDTSSYFSRKAYPLIHEIENLLRQLIAQFMLTTVGREWVQETTPGEVKLAIDANKRKDYLNVLHSVDFITLGDFLFRPYATKPKEELFEKLKVAKEVDLPELRTYIPQSNWKRYFASLVACDDSYLDSRWRELYDLRCKVAHNALLTRVEHERIVLLVGEVKSKLDDAVRKLNQVSVPVEEISALAERDPASAESLGTDSNMNRRRVLIQKLRLQSELSRLAGKNGLSSRIPLYERLRVLLVKGVVTPELQASFLEVHQGLSSARTATGKLLVPIEALQPLLESAGVLTNELRSIRDRQISESRANTKKVHSNASSQQS